MTIRKATTEDIGAILEIYEVARRFMRDTGNLNQWINGYPSEKQLRDDIREQCCHVCIDAEGEIVGTFFFRQADDVTYFKIYDGAWLNNKPYAVVHRLASSRKHKRIADFCLQWCLEQFPNIRVDTHRDNLVMQHILQKNGYVYCGIIFLLNGSERMAFQKSCE